jgi:hypothetical protein
MQTPRSPAFSVHEDSWPFRHWIIDGVIPEQLLKDSFHSLPAADWPGWVRYNNDCERKRTANDLYNLTGPVRQLFEGLNGWGWLAFLRRLTSIAELQNDPTLHGAGIHISDPGDFLSAHIDFALHPKAPLFERRLNLVLFLTEWRREWGGEFELFDDEGREVLKTVSPAFNRAVIWEPTDTAFHGTAEVRGPAPRVTAAVYYLSPARGGVTRKRALFVPRREK